MVAFGLLAVADTVVVAGVVGGTLLALAQALPAAAPAAASSVFFSWLFSFLWWRLFCVCVQILLVLSLVAPAQAELRHPFCLQSHVSLCFALFSALFFALLFA